MKIGIDIDNTITDTLPILKEYCKKYNEEVVKRNLSIDEKGFTSFSLYKWTNEENMDFCTRYLQEIVLQAKVKENAKEIIHKLREEGNIIYIITARIKPYFKTPYETTEKFLNDNGIEYDELLVGRVDKEKFCIEKNLDIMIEDEPQNINPISKIIPVIAFKEIYNEECNGKNIIKVSNWNEVYNIIKNRKEGIEQ